jgi:hypothetical protein
MFSTELLVQTLISGLMVGVLYALMALGITFIYSIVKMINWAMGEFYMIGSYIQFVAVHVLLGPHYWWLAAAIAAAGTFLIGLLLEPILIKPMYDRPMQRRDDYATVVTIALLLLLRSLAVALGGPNQYRPESDLPVVWIGPLPRRARGSRRPPAPSWRWSPSGSWSRRPGSGSPCARPHRIASGCRPRASTSGDWMQSPSPSASRSPASPAPCSRRCSWCFPPMAR